MCILLFKNWKINTLSSKRMQTEKAKSSHFDRTRGFKNQIFPTLVLCQVKLLSTNLNSFLLIWLGWMTYKIPKNEAPLMMKVYFWMFPNLGTLKLARVSYSYFFLQYVSLFASYKDPSCVKSFCLVGLICLIFQC